MRIVPPSLHPEVISRHQGRDPATGELMKDDALAALVNAASFGYEVCSKVIETHGKILGNQMATPIANETRARETIFKMQESATKRIDAAIAIALSARDSEIAKFANPAKAKNIDEALVASDTRKALARMPSNERRRAVDAAINAGDDMMVSSVLNAPSLASGFSQMETDSIRSNWQRLRFPNEVARAGRLDRAMDDLTRGGQSMIAFCNSFTSASRVQNAIDSEKLAMGSA